MVLVFFFILLSSNLSIASRLLPSARHFANKSRSFPLSQPPTPLFPLLSLFTLWFRQHLAAGVQHQYAYNTLLNSVSFFTDIFLTLSCTSGAMTTPIPRQCRYFLSPDSVLSRDSDVHKQPPHLSRMALASLCAYQP